MTWTLTVASDAEKNLRRIPSRNRARLVQALQEMQKDPFSVTSLSFARNRSVTGDVWAHTEYYLMLT
jgi:mRNA-degrading endonuclease RelE of RelBE toxin-antitoxin system